MSRSWSRWHTKIFPQPSSSPVLPLPCSMVCIFQAVNCPHLRRQYMFNECFSCICIGFSEFNKPAMCGISHCHFFSIMLFVLPFRTEHSTCFILSKVCHFVGRLKHKITYLEISRVWNCPKRVKIQLYHPNYNFHSSYGIQRAINKTRRTSAWTQPSFSSYNDRAPRENVHHVIMHYSPYELLSMHENRPCGSQWKDTRGHTGHKGTKETQGTQGDTEDTGDTRGHKETQGTQGDTRDTRGHWGNKGTQGIQGDKRDTRGPRGHKGHRGHRGYRGHKLTQGSEETQVTQGAQGT